MQRYVLVPGNLDADELIRKYPPQTSGFVIEKMLGIIDLIYKQSAYTKWEKYNNHTQILSSVFYKLADDYLVYVNYLVKARIISWDKSYRPAKEFPNDPKSMGYKFLEPYNKHLPVLFNLATLNKSDRRITRSRSSISKTRTLKNAHQYTSILKEYPFVKYLDKLDFDFEGAYKLLNRLSGSTIPSNASDVEISEAIHKLTSYATVVEQFQEVPSKRVIIDDFGKRLHSPLTSLKKPFRQFLKYRGQNLIGLDLKNAQPFLALALMKESFWLEQIQPSVDGLTQRGKAILSQPLARRIVVDINSVKNRLPQILNIGDLYPELAQDLWGYGDREREGRAELNVNPSMPERRPKDKVLKSGQLDYDPRLVKSNQPELLTILNGISLDLVDNESVIKFQEDVVNGRIYEKLIDELERMISDNANVKFVLSENNLPWNTQGDKRKAAKSLMVMAMFSPNKSRRPLMKLAREILKRCYPEIAWFFIYLKRADYTLLAKLLQRVESFLILKACAKAIRLSNKQIPIWTIHDNIVTTAYHKNQVYQIMRETIKKYIGYAPEIGVEDWTEYKPDSISLFEQENENDFEAQDR